MLILSASNVKKTKKKSLSLEIAVAVKDALKEFDISSEVLDLRKYNLTLCIMCEKCVKSGKCVRGDDYNKLAKKIIKHRDIIIVCPHYAGIPSKIMMLLEKLQEVCYLKSCTKQKDAYPLKGAVAAVIAHGGMTDNYDALYTANIITPLGNALKAVAYEYINDTTEEPLCIGVKQYFEKRERQSVCFLKENDIKKIRNVVKKLTHSIAQRMESGGKHTHNKGEAGMKKFWLFTMALFLSAGVIFAQHPFFDAGSSYEGSEDINTTEPAIGYFVQLPDIDRINEDKPFVVGAEMIYSANSKIITLPLSYYVITENKTIYAFKLMVPYVMRKISFKFDPDQEFSGSGIGDITIGADMYTKLGEMPVFAQLLVKTPTGKVDNESKENEFAYIPLGTGTWDFALSVGLTKYIDNVTLKGKVGYRMNGTYENTHAETLKQEFKFGNMMHATINFGMPLSDSMYFQTALSYINNGTIELTNTYLATDTKNVVDINGSALSLLDISPQIDYTLNGFTFSAGVIIPVYSAWGDPKPEEMVPGEGIPDPERAIKIKFGFQHPF